MEVGESAAAFFGEAEGEAEEGGDGREGGVAPARVGAAGVGIGVRVVGVEVGHDGFLGREGFCESSRGAEGDWR